MAGESRAPRTRTARESKRGDLRVAQCKLCRAGIFRGQVMVWVSTPGVLGLVHESCRRLHVKGAQRWQR